MKPSRDLIERVVAEEAAKAGSSPNDVIHMRLHPAAVTARTLAWAKIIQETGCRPSELADAWGCSREAIYTAFARPAKPEPEPPSTYNAATRARLRWHHPDRAASIIAGTDPDTNTDIAAWRRLGAHGRRASA